MGELVSAYLRTEFLYDPGIQRLIEHFQQSPFGEGFNYETELLQGKLPANYAASGQCLIAFLRHSIQPAANYFSIPSGMRIWAGSR